MRHITSFSIPKPQSLALVAAGEGANKGFWRRQWRDRYKRFVDMGRSIKFKVRLDDGRVVNVIGKFQGSSDAIFGRVYVEGDPNVPDGYYYVTSDNGATVIATLKQADLDRMGIEPGKDYEGNAVTARDEAAIQDIGTIKYEPKKLDVGKPATERKENLSGSEVQERKLSTVTQNLKEEGRFPVPRQTTTTHWGEESDIAKGAKEDYNLVYENLKNQDPAWKEKYPTFDDFWGRVKELSVGQMSQSPNSLDEIPQEMKDINRAYAERVLNMNPDGKITFYRNAVNKKGTPEESALGYVTTNADFAYDYNSQAPNTDGNGRYEIDAKPDEVFGMLGYSQLEDEFGVVIGRGITSQPDRVRRVGDLAQPELAPWLEKYQDGVGRSTGGTPYRHYALAGQFDLLPVDPLGENSAEFLEKHGKTAADIKAKFDELYGEGAYDEYKASDEVLGFGDIKRLFVDVGDGKVGLDITKIDGKDGSLAPGGYGNGDPASFKNDKTDNTLKMLSVFQELSGQPFMVHRSRTDELPAEVKETDSADVTARYKPSEYGEILKLDETDEDEYSDVLNDAIDEYTGMGFNYMNDYLRGGVDDVDEETKEQIDALQEHAMSTTLPEPMSFLRSQTTWGGYDFVQQEDGTYSLEKSDSSGNKEVRSLESIVGERWESKGFLSTTTELSAGKPLKNRYGKEMKFQMHILAPEGSHGVTLGFEEREFLMPHGLSYTVVKADTVDGQANIWVELDPPSPEPEAAPEQPQEIKELDNYFADEPEVEGTNSFNNPFTEDPDLEDEQVEVLEWFTDDGYEKVTDFLRGGKDISDSSKEKLETILDLIDESSVKLDTLIYRGRVYNSDITDQWEQVLDLKVGDEFVDRGVASTTTDKQRAAFYADMDFDNTVGRALFRIVARKGQKGFKIPDSASSYGSQEQEVLLPPNTKYRVTGINTVEGTRIVDVEIIEQEPKRASVDDYAAKAEPEAKVEEPVDSELNLEFKNVLSEHDYLYNQKLDLTELPEPKSQELKKVDDVLIVANSDGELPKSFVSTAEDLVSLYPIDKSNNAGLAYGNKSVTIAYDPNLLNAIKVQARINPQWGIYLDVNNGGARNPIIVISGDPDLMNTDLKSYSQTENSIKIGLDQLLATEDGLDPSITVADYRVAHEFGHMLSESMIDSKEMTSGKMLDASMDNEKYLKTSKQHMSGYGYTSYKEMYAEAFAAWYVTRGKATSPIVKDFAERFGWKVPKEEKPQPDQALQANYSTQEMSAIYNYIFEDKINETIGALKDKPIQSYIDAANGKESEVSLDGLTKDQLDAIKAIEGLDSAIANTKFEADTSVHRGIRVSPEKFEDFVSRATEGSTWASPTFSSTSKDPAIAERFATDLKGMIPVVIQYDMPKGSSGLDIDILDIDGGYGDEEEVLLARDAKFEVVSAERKAIGSDGVEGLYLTVRPKVDAPKPAAPIPTPIKPLPKVKPKEKVKVDRSKLPMPVVEVNEPVYNILNSDKPVFINGFIAVPDSPEARALSQIGKDPSKKERDALRKQTLDVLTTDPNYKPLPPQDADFDALTPAGESAFTYVDSSLLINNGLRDADPDMENSKQVKDIDEAMALSAHLPPGATVYRMLKLSTWERLNPQPGQVLIDRAYSSTSHTKVFSDEARDIDTQTGDVNQIPMRIVMPNNTSGIDLSTISWYDTEDEYLLPRQTALRFLGWDSDGYAVFERIS